jgi:ketosteroid isomerase-like protein
MSKDNLQLIQEAFDAYFRGDEPALLAVVDPDIVVTQLADQPDNQHYRGHDGLVQAMSDWVGSWDDYSIEVLGMNELNDHVLVSCRQRGRGKGSGIAIEHDVHFLFTFRGGKLTRWQMFHTERDASEAAEVPQ